MDAQKLQRDREQAVRYRHAITTNLDYQRERAEYADKACVEFAGTNLEQGWKAERHDAWCAFLAVSAVARQAGLV